MTIVVVADVTRGQTTLDSACFTGSGTSALTYTTRFVRIPIRHAIQMLRILLETRLLSI